MKTCELVLLILISVRLIKAYGYSEDFYSIPTPEIVVTTRGFCVSIPDEPGMEMFFFHGSINREMRFLEPGTITISAKVPNNGQWVLEYNDSTLKLCDTIYFWLYVKKRGKTYTRAYDKYVITDILPFYPKAVPWSATRPSRHALAGPADPSDNYNSCLNENHNMKQTITRLQSKIADLENTIQKLSPSPTPQQPDLRRRDGFDKETWVWT